MFSHQMGVAGEKRRLDRPKMGGVTLACTLLACANALTPGRMPAAPKTAQKVATVEALGEAVAVAAPDAFDWFDHWYPVNVVDSMDPSRPHKEQLLGLNLVLWNDGATVRREKAAGSWRAFEDVFFDGACFEAQVDTTAFEDLPACDDYTDSDEEEEA